MRRLASTFKIPSQILIRHCHPAVCPTNKRRRPAKGYMGIAIVTSGCARKDFNLRLNPDEHWSAAFYKGLNQLQYIDET